MARHETKVLVTRDEDTFSGEGSTTLYIWRCGDVERAHRDDLLEPGQKPYGYWRAKEMLHDIRDCMSLPRDWFPEITWASEPVEMALTLEEAKKPHLPEGARVVGPGYAGEPG